jgi:bis(5'-nucleosidyl)-tetraphosphatase
MKYEKSCGAIVVDDGKVLLVKHNAGHWDFPKGHVEEGETEIETAIREVKEETNIDIKIEKENKYISEYSPKENVMKTVIYFIGEKVGGEDKPQIEEVSDVEWVDVNKAVERITHQRSKEIMMQVIKDMNL